MTIFSFKKKKYTKYNDTYCSRGELISMYIDRLEGMNIHDLAKRYHKTRFATRLKIRTAEFLINDIICKIEANYEKDRKH